MNTQIKDKPLNMRGRCDRCHKMAWLPVIRSHADPEGYPDAVCADCSDEPSPDEYRDAAEALRRVQPLCDDEEDALTLEALAQASDRKASDWKPGDPCGVCRSTDTTETPTSGGVCRSCGARDSDDV